MPTKVYLSGDEIVVDQTAYALLKIPVDRAKFFMQGNYPTNPLAVTYFEGVKFMNLLTEEIRVDSIANIQDSGGTPIGDELAVRNYLEGFFRLGETKYLQLDPSGGAGGGAFLTTVNIDNTFSPYAVSSGYIVVADSSGGDIIVNLPVGVKDDEITVKKDDTSAARKITINGAGGQTIDGSAFIELKGSLQPSVTLVFDGANWHII